MKKNQNHLIEHDVQALSILALCYDTNPSYDIKHIPKIKCLSSSMIVENRAETRKCVLFHCIHKPNHVQIALSTMMKSETTEEIIKKVQTEIF